MSPFISVNDSRARCFSAVRASFFYAFCRVWLVSGMPSSLVRLFSIPLSVGW